MIDAWRALYLVSKTICHDFGSTPLARTPEVYLGHLVTRAFGRVSRCKQILSCFSSSQSFRNPAGGFQERTCHIWVLVHFSDIPCCLGLARKVKARDRSAFHEYKSIRLTGLSNHSSPSPRAFPRANSPTAPARQQPPPRIPLTIFTTLCAPYPFQGHTNGKE